MSLSSSFNLLSFQRKVGDALRAVERTLELERSPRLAGDVDHTYGAKYGLVNLSSSAAIVAYMNCFEKLGLGASELKSIDTTKPATLRFDASTSSVFVKEVKVDVPADTSYEATVASGNVFKKKYTAKAVHHITEFHHDVETNWTISIYSGTAVDEKNVIKSRSCKEIIVTQSKAFDLKSFSPIELPLTWLLKQIDTDGLLSQFKVDTENDKTKTPRRNEAVDSALEFASRLSQWSRGIQQSFVQGHLRQILRQHNPALSNSDDSSVRNLNDVLNLQHSIFNPILPLMEEKEQSSGSNDSNDIEIKSILALKTTSNLADGEDHKTSLSSTDISKLLNEHVRTLDEAISAVEAKWSNRLDRLLSSSEVTLSLLLDELCQLTAHYADSVAYVESMMESQLISAIGKRLTPSDLEVFVKYHNARLLSPMPHPFSHAIRRPEHYPVGLLSIESADDENNSIHSHSREVNATSSLIIPLNAATVLELTGRQHLHGWMNHRFGPGNKNHQLVARARQFSAFILVMGNMIDGSTLSPKDAIIVQNKDELMIPLLLEELPTAKEFKDAVKSLSPEQQRFARAYRSMQLSSSVFGICIVQIKPQLEALLGLPADSLDKEMKLTQDLMELFIEYQVPSDLLSYNGHSESAAVEDKISNVRDNVKGVLGVVEAEKEKQLKSERTKTDMAIEKRFQSRSHSSDDESGGSMCAEESIYEDACYSAPKSRSRGARSIMKSRQPMMALAMRSAAPAPGRLQHMKVKSANVVADPSESKFDTETQEQQQPTQVVKRALDKGGPPQVPAATDNGVDFTLIPKILDSAVENSEQANALRSTTIKTSGDWARNRQENLISSPKKQSLGADEIKAEKNKAFDLLDALSRSGSLPIAYSELHVVVAVTHCFDKDVMSTVVCDNINPIEKLEGSTLLLASAVHGVPARDLVKDASELQRLEGTLPLLLAQSENNEER